MCVKDTGTKYQLWISDFNIDGTFTRVHPFIISPRGTVVRSSWLINLFSVFAFLDTTHATVYYNIKYNKLKT